MNRIKRAIIAIIITAASIGISAQTRINAGVGILDREIASSLSIQTDITPLFAFAAQAHAWSDHTNISLALKTDITYIFTKRKDRYQLDANTGMGWGHYFFQGPTDHNYHTYNIGIDLYRHFGKFSWFATPMVSCRTWQGHIGLHMPSYLFTTGISINL